VAGSSAVGVPEITPVVGLKLRPGDSGEEIPYEVGAPPLLDGTSFVMVWPSVKTAGFAEYISPAGAITFVTVMFRSV
jgi:hypothetical protein